MTLTLFCRWCVEWMLRAFTAQPAALAIAAQFLRVISWNFVASGLVFTCSALFQGLGNTMPAVLSSAVVSMALQALVSLWLVRGEFRRCLSVTAGSLGSGWR